MKDVLGGNKPKMISGNAFDIVLYSSIDSTNKRAREYSAHTELTKPLIIIADLQTDGRGRMGRNFYSPASVGLYMTLLTEAPADDGFSRLTVLASVCLREALFDSFGVLTEIKWVNDLYFCGRKVAGILAESFEENGKRYIALGAGINLTTESFPDDIADKAGALLKGRKKVSQRKKKMLAVSFCDKLIEAVNSDDMGRYLSVYRSASCVLGREIEFTSGGERKKARAVDINEKGALCVLTDNGENIELSGGEISIFTDIK